ncbi:MAG: hypothetical protein Q7S74_00065 [Nanoarchaeota archaeon]|nr:hypothetical protein [Nanoarchaeota archaeon]
MVAYHNKSEQNKKGAIELSIGTVVIIVLAMAMLILGLVLVRSIFKGAIDSVDITNRQVQAQITSLFSKDDTNLAILLGADKTARIQAGSGLVTVGFGAKLSSGRIIQKRSDLTYKLSLDTSQTQREVLTCDRVLGGENNVKKLFLQNFDSNLNFDQLDGKGNAFAGIQIDIPKGTPKCTQKIYIDVLDHITDPTAPSSVGADYFILEVTGGSIFGS